jgi:hypothetical protein
MILTTNFINSFPVKEEFNRMQFIENGKLLINRTNMYGVLENKLSLIDSMGNITKIISELLLILPHRQIW